NAGGPVGPRPGGEAVRGDARGLVPGAGGDRRGRWLVLVDPAPACIGPARPAACTDGADPHGRPGPERRAGGHRAPARAVRGPSQRRSAPVVRRRLLRLKIPFRQPYVTSAGVANARELVVLRLEDESGVAGFGEVAPFEPYDGVP